LPINQGRKRERTETRTGRIGRARASQSPEIYRSKGEETVIGLNRRGSEVLTLGEDEEARGEESQAGNSVGFEMGAKRGEVGER